MGIYEYFKEEQEYSFFSVGRKGAVKKVVRFEKISGGVYNIFLESEFEELRLGDTERTNNGDGWSVLQTVGAIINHYLSEYPQRIIYLAGSDQQRNNVYKLGLRRNSNWIFFGSPFLSGPYSIVDPDKDYSSFIVFLKHK